MLRTICRALNRTTSRRAARRLRGTARKYLQQHRLSTIYRRSLSHSVAGGGQAENFPTANVLEPRFMKRQRIPVVSMDRTIAEVSISFTEEERTLIELLREVIRDKTPETTVRLAGGWVRDKLLGRITHDIDVALDNSTGLAFAEKVNEQLAARGDKQHSINVIKANPDQSKHLETATVKVFEFPLDFVNLRAEEYSEASRIPTVRFGTPTEDAERRDFTINSMFYNVNANSIEDFIGTGFEDLCRGLIRTPVEPRRTFLDDPLRVLRAVRFASRYAFALEDSLRAAVVDEEVRTALLSKVSRERVGTELDGMLTGARPIGAIRCLHDRRLLPLVFTGPDEAATPAGAGQAALNELFSFTPWDPDGEAALSFAAAASRVVEALSSVLRSAAERHRIPAILNEARPRVVALEEPEEGAERLTVHGGEAREPAHAAASQPHLLPETSKAFTRARTRRKAMNALLWLLSDEETPEEEEPAAAGDGGEKGTKKDKKKKKKQVTDVPEGEATKARLRWLVLAAVLRPLAGREVNVPDARGRMKESSAVTAVIRHSLKYSNADIEAVERIIAGSVRAEALAAMRTDDAEWLRSAGNCIRASKELWMEAFTLGWAHASIEEPDAALERFQAAARRVEASGLSECWTWAPRFDGRALQQEFGLRPGPVVGEVLKEQWDWMFEHPDGSEDELRAFLQRRIEEKQLG